MKRKLERLIAKFLKDGDYAAFRSAQVEIMCRLANSEHDAARRLCDSIEWELADFSEGLIDESRLKALLQEILPGGSRQILAYQLLRQPVGLAPETRTGSPTSFVSLTWSF